MNLFVLKVVWIMTTICLVSSLTPPQSPESTMATSATTIHTAAATSNPAAAADDISMIMNRRHVISTIISSSAVAMTMITSGIASAGIDVSNLRQEPVIPKSTDIFLGGTYYAKDEIVNDRVGRIKYSIELEGLMGVVGGGGLKNSKRAIKVIGRSSTISNRSDYYVELTGAIYPCPIISDESDIASTTNVANTSREQKQQQQCISIDFSPINGPNNVQGFWDVQEQGVRFLMDDLIWSKE